MTHETMCATLLWLHLGDPQRTTTAGRIIAACLTGYLAYMRLQVGGVHQLNHSKGSTRASLQ